MNSNCSACLKIHVDFQACLLVWLTTIFLTHGSGIKLKDGVIIHFVASL